MNKKIFGRILAWALTLAVLLTSGAMGTVNTAFAANKKVTKVTATAKPVASTELRENVKLTKALLKKILKVGYTYKVGKTTKKVNNYTGFTSPQIGKKVVSNKAGKMKITVKAFNKKATVNLKVNKMTGISITDCYLVLFEDDKFSEKAFKGSSKVEAFFQKGSTLEISSYKVTVPSSTVKADKDGYFRVTVSRNGFSDTIAVPVVKKGEPVPSVEPSQVPETATPSVSPSESPSGTPSATASAKPSVTPSVSPSATPSTKPSQTPGNNGGGDIIIINPPSETCRPTAKPSATPSASPSAKPSTAPSTEPTATPTPEYTVTILSPYSTIKLNGRNMSFVNNEAQTKVPVGTSIALSVTDSSNARFVRWINADTGEEISTSVDLEFAVTSDIRIMAVFDEVFNITVKFKDGRGKVSVDGKSLDFYDGEATTKLTPGRYNFEVTPADGYKFGSCTDESGKTISTSTSFSIAIPGNTTYTINFSDEEKTVNVSYKHESGQLIKSEVVAFGETLAPPTDSIWYPDKTLAGWKLNGTVYEGTSTDIEFYANGTKLSDAIKALTAAKQDVVVTSYYVANVPKTYTVSIDGGTFKTPANVSGQNAGEFENNTTASVVPNEAPAGKVFSHWEDSSGNIKSYDETYTFLVGANVSLIAIFDDKPADVKPVVTLDSYELDTTDYGVNFRISCNVPDTYTKIGWGILLSTKLSGEQITYDSGALVLEETLYSSTLVVSNGGYAAPLDSYFFDNKITMEARAYMIVKSSAGTEYLYSTNTFRFTCE